MLLIDMDGTVTTKRYALELAIATARDAAVIGLLDGEGDDAQTRSKQIAKQFQGEVAAQMIGAASDAQQAISLRRKAAGLARRLPAAAR
ncbi:MAG: hypothetical protein ACO26U_13390 [Burkholderiaceae bacterium]